MASILSFDINFAKQEKQHLFLLLAIALIPDKMIIHSMVRATYELINDQDRELNPKLE